MLPFIGSLPKILGFQKVVNFDLGILSKLQNIPQLAKIWSGGAGLLDFTVEDEQVLYISSTRYLELPYYFEL